MKGTDEFTGVSQLLGAHVRAAPEVFACGPPNLQYFTFLSDILCNLVDRDQQSTITSYTIPSSDTYLCMLVPTSTHTNTHPRTCVYIYTCIYTHVCILCIIYICLQAFIIHLCSPNCIEQIS